MKKHPSDNIALLSQHGLLLCSLVFVLLTLAACGGGGGGDTSSSGSILSISDSDLDGEESSGNDNDGTSGSGYTVLAANDLGMHCADLDYQIFSILPPFNVVHA